MEVTSEPAARCRQCGGPFTRPWQKQYCSHKCMGEASRRGEPRACHRCGVTFYVSPAFTVGGGGRYCSTDCYHATRRAEARGCVQCGQPTQNRKYCSRRCYDEFRRAEARSCAQCGQPTRSRKYCSPRCTGLGRRRRVTRPCAAAGCQNVVTAEPNQLAAGQGQYCSRACADLGRRRGATLRCARCGASFYASRTQVTRHRQFCSRNCWRGDRGLRTVPCQRCGKPIERWTSQLAHGRGKYCSRTCYHEKRWKPRLERTCAYSGCRKRFGVAPWQAGRSYHSRQCWRLALGPRTFRCRACGRPFRRPAWRRPAFCSTACAQQPGSRRYRARERSRILVERDRRILALLDDGLRAPAIQAQLRAERPEHPVWHLSRAGIRVVIFRARRAGARAVETRAIR
jgi:hypothetical protein